MDKSILQLLHPENIKLTINQKPFSQSQDESWSIRGVTYNDNDLFICTRGSARFILDGKPYTLSKAEALIVRKGVVVQAKKIGRENFDAVAQHFDLELFERIDLFSLFHFSRQIRFKNWEFVETVLERYLELSRGSDKPILGHSLFYTILCEFIHDAYIGDKEIDPNQDFIVRITTMIDYNLDDDDIVTKAMEDSPYSYDYTAKIFKRYLGMTPKKYFIQMRIKRAKDYLVQGFSVKEAAGYAGFNDELYFSRLFKKYEGISPKDWKTLHTSVESLVVYPHS